MIPQAKQENCLCVDLDGTLIKTDLLVESFVQFIKRNPLNLFKALFWLLKGKAWLKHQLAQKVVLDAEQLPFNKEVIALCKERCGSVYLVTGSNAIYAKTVSEYLGLFDGHFGSDEKLNLTGAKKANFLKERFPEGFEYIGDSGGDIPVWKSAIQGYSVKKSRHGGLENVEHLAVDKKGNIKSAVKLVRTHQWAKNLLVFIPLILAHEITRVDSLAKTLLAFICFSFMASSVYVLNDFLDVWSDRRHPKKKKRPLASGDLPLIWGGGVFILLFASALSVSSLFISLPATAVLGGYFAANILYSFYLKRVMLLDIFILTSFYIFRIMYGGESAGVEVSYWLVSFSFFIFLSLAFLKRFAELKVLFKYHGRKSAEGRDYEFDDIPVLMGFGMIAGVASVLILALYIQFGNQFQLYSQPQILWGIEVLVLYWICLFWMRASRGKIEDDPVKFAITDKVSWIIVVLAVLLGGFAV